MSSPLSSSRCRTRSRAEDCAHHQHLGAREAQCGQCATRRRRASCHTGGNGHRSWPKYAPVCCFSLILRLRFCMMPSPGLPARRSLVMGQHAVGLLDVLPLGALETRHAGPRISGWRAIIDRDRELCTKVRPTRRGRSGRSTLSCRSRRSTLRSSGSRGRSCIAAGTGRRCRPRLQCCSRWTAPRHARCCARRGSKWYPPRFRRSSWACTHG